MFSLKTYEMLHQLEAHSTSVNCLQFDERFIVTGGNDGRIKLWGASAEISSQLICRGQLTALVARLPHGRLYSRPLRAVARYLASRHS